jgi:D-alanyl-lipoteichoic acid acyltransferase DltB (MBOAT superfamily)
VFRGNLKAARNPLDFMLYVAFFPHLVAGPIVRASFLLPQCQRPRVVNPIEVLNGVWQILMGYVKKIVIADRLAEITSWGFGQPAAPFSDANAWLVIYAFAFQIYGDFSGYSDIARGLAKLMGFELITNFTAPYLVTNPSDFWRNWHISLSTWLRDYLYIPLGGNRRGASRTYANLMITMLLGGLWHGAGLAYVLWGFYHGTLLAVHRAWCSFVGSVAPANKLVPGQTRSRSWRRAQHFLLVLLFFHITCVGWLLFRAGSVPPKFDQIPLVCSYLQAMFHWPLAAGVSPLAWPIILLGGLALFFQWQYEKMDHFSAWKTSWQAVAMTVALAAITGLGVFEGARFIYFQF